jgi:hypothetical protein
MITSYLSETTERGNLFMFGVSQVSVYSPETMCVMHLSLTVNMFPFQLLLLYCSLHLCPVHQWTWNSNSKFSVPKGECAPSIYTRKVPCKWCTSHFGRTDYAFLPLISIAHLHVFIQNGKVSSHSKSQTQCHNQSLRQKHPFFITLCEWVFILWWIISIYPTLGLHVSL